MRWAIITGLYNASDLVTEFCRYHFSLGVDKIYVADYGSDDSTLDRLRPFVEAGKVERVPLPTHHFATYNPSNAILKTIREQDAADWVSFLDPDEFLTGPEDIKEMLSQEASRGVEAIAVPRANLTGIGPIGDNEHYLTHLTLKVVKTDTRVSDASATLSSPWIFSRLPPKVMVRPRPDLTITDGDHNVVGAAKAVLSSSLELLHLPMRSYAAFQTKIELGAEYLRRNPELSPGTAWHWRRWIQLLESGRLREEYEKQFLDEMTAQALLAEGRLMQEPRLADWWTRAGRGSPGDYL
jgi:hypothetical protein